MLILIHPPVSKPCEPPAGIASLAGMLETAGVSYLVLDTNLEGLLYLLGIPLQPEKLRDNWTTRALRNRKQNINLLRDHDLYNNFDRYKRTVRDLTRAVNIVAQPDINIGLADYEHKSLSPVRSTDLIAAAEHPELNPFYPYFSSRLHSLMRSNAIDTAGFSINYLSQALCAFSMIGFLKREYPEIKIITGGGLVTSWGKNTDLKKIFSGLIDNAVSGPGELRLLELLNKDFSGKQIRIPGYKKMPLSEYLSPGLALPYSASSGCYWKKCAFCPEKAEDNPYVPIPAARVISDLNYLIEKTNPSLIHMLDNALSPSLLTALSQNGLAVPWYGFARINSSLADPEFCIALKRSGCVMLKLGVESGDQGVLDALHKGINIETASSALKAIKKAGIATYIYLMFGTPAETEKSAEKTLEFTARHSEYIDFLNLAIFNMPLCGETPAGITTKRFYSGDLSLYTDFVHPAGWDRKHVRAFLDEKFKRLPAVSEILKKDPPVFTSNHAPFFVICPH